MVKISFNTIKVSFLIFTTFFSANAFSGWSIIDISSLGRTYTAPASINDSGQIAGSSTISPSSGITHAFITRPSVTGITYLGTLGPFNSSSASINNSGQIVGMFTGFDGMFHPFVNGPNGSGMTGGRDSSASDINNNGQIVGYGFHNSDPDHLHGFMMSFTPETKFSPNPIYIPTLPVPEPSTNAMLLAGLIFLSLKLRNSIFG